MSPLKHVFLKLWPRHKTYKHNHYALLKCKNLFYQMHKQRVMWCLLQFAPRTFEGQKTLEHQRFYPRVPPNMRLFTRKFLRYMDFEVKIKAQLINLSLSTSSSILKQTTITLKNNGGIRFKPPPPREPSWTY